MVKPIMGAVFATVLLIGGSVTPGFAQEPKRAAASERKPSAAITAMRARQKKCGAEWKTAKAAGTVDKGMKWPKYWSACNKRLKAAG